MCSLIETRIYISNFVIKHFFYKVTFFLYRRSCTSKCLCDGCKNGKDVQEIDDSSEDETSSCESDLNSTASESILSEENGILDFLDSCSESE